METTEKPTEVATNNPLLVNNYGQDIEFRVAPDGKNRVDDWCPLPQGDQMPVVAPTPSCTLEIRITLKQPIDEALEMIEVTRNLQVKCKQRGEPSQPKAPTQKSGPNKPGGPKHARSKWPAQPDDNHKAAS